MFFSKDSRQEPRTWSLWSMALETQSQFKTCPKLLKVQTDSSTSHSQLHSICHASLLWLSIESHQKCIECHCVMWRYFNGSSPVLSICLYLLFQANDGKKCSRSTVSIYVFYFDKVAFAISFYFYNSGLATEVWEYYAEAWGQGLFGG